MKSTLSCLLACVALLTFASCQKEIPTKLTGYFYTTDTQIDESQYRLFVDGVEKGPLPYINKDLKEITSIDSGMKMQSLKVEIMSGRHLIQAKNDAGKIISSSELNFKFYKHKTEMGLQGNVGGSGYSTFEKNTEVVIWMGKGPE